METLKIADCGFYRLKDLKTDEIVTILSFQVYERRYLSKKMEEFLFLSSKYKGVKMNYTYSDKMILIRCVRKDWREFTLVSPYTLEAKYKIDRFVLRTFRIEKSSLIDSDFE
jgi:hypothetical protein